ncbi:MAG: hypothetical protein GY822_24230, partial [Deltaproteobacteria bacterium]|nr:hypothetical protein [Deltaproteobacteria bacterium]
ERQAAGVPDMEQGGSVCGVPLCERGESFDVFHSQKIGDTDFLSTMPFVVCLQYKRTRVLLTEASWEDIFSFARGQLTIEQLETVDRWLDADYPHELATLPACLPSETRTPRDGVSEEALFAMVSDGNSLCLHGETDRAADLVARWSEAMGSDWWVLKRHDLHRKMALMQLGNLVGRVAECSKRWSLIDFFLVGSVSVKQSIVAQQR